MTRALPVFAALALASLGGAAHAETPWIFVVGNNVGLSEDAPLRYAERDATEVATVFQKLGGVTPDRAVVLLGQDDKSLRALLVTTAQRIKLEPDASLIVYYSGHADARGLHLAGSILPFGELEKLVADVPAKLRLLIVDACRSGGVTRVKGVRPAAKFEIAGDDTQLARGIAVITSSAAGEDSYESERLRASFFSHHLVTGLRGAADEDGDSRVALDEAYRYTYDETLKSSGATSALQHPTFRFDVRGRGAVILTRLGGDENRTRLLLPAVGTYLVIEGSSRGSVVAEATTRRENATLTLAPGRYFVQERQPTFYKEYEVRLAAGEEKSLASYDPKVVDYARLVRKGGGERALSHGLRVHGGVRGGVLDGQDPGAQLMLGYGLDLRQLSLGARLRWSPPAALGDPSDDGLERESTDLGLSLTLQRFFDFDWASFGVGIVAEGAWFHQSFLRGGQNALAPSRDSFAAAFGVLMTFQLPLAGGFQLELEGGPLAVVYERAQLENGAVRDRQTASAVTWFVTGGLAWTF